MLAHPLIKVHPSLQNCLSETSNVTTFINKQRSHPPCSSRNEDHWLNVTPVPKKDELNWTKKECVSISQKEKERIGFSRCSLSTISSTFNSLFKVLCIFPSRYLCAIGFPLLFSFRWNLPPNFGLHSQTTRLINREQHTFLQKIDDWASERDCHPPWCLFPKDFDSLIQSLSGCLVARLQFGNSHDCSHALTPLTEQTHALKEFQILNLSLSRFTRRY